MASKQENVVILLFVARVLFYFFRSDAKSDESIYIDERKKPFNNDPYSPEKFSLARKFAGEKRVNRGLNKMAQLPDEKA